LDLGNGVKKEKKEMGLLIKKINNKKKEKEVQIENQVTSLGIVPT
jgi:hypothetical protein